MKNTYFWIALALFVLSIAGFMRGGDYIRDPGQLEKVNVDLLIFKGVVTNSHLAMIYLASAVVMLINGIISHKLWLRQVEEES
jgi:hypothetical protein